MADESALIVNVLPSHRAKGEARGKGGGRGGEEAERLAGGWGRGLYHTCDVFWDASSSSGHANQVLVFQAKSRNRKVAAISRDFHGTGKKKGREGAESQPDQETVCRGGMAGDDDQRPRCRKVRRLPRGDVCGCSDAGLGVGYREEEPISEVGFASLVDDVGVSSFSSEWKHVTHRHVY